jgi:ribulose-5-phosphate 4-epimerase/fuculose-1-phosphate aldolase
MEMVRDLAMTLGDGQSLLLKRHGAVGAAPNLRQGVFNAICMRDNAELLQRSLLLGDPDVLTAEEIALSAQKHDGGAPIARAWEYWAARL